MANTVILMKGPDRGNAGEPTPALYDDVNGSEPNGIIIDALTVDSGTFHSIGINWDVGGGDQNYDATVTVKYRKVGDPLFKNAANLFRQDYAWYWDPDLYVNRGPYINNFAGSLMFLTPGTTYEVVLELSDPDGGSAIRVFEATTRAIPVKPTPSTTHYVDNSWGGPFNGTDAEPYNTIQLADAAASPGDRVIIKKGSGVYTNSTPTAGLQTAGEPDNWIVYEAENRLDPPILNGIGIEVGYLWFDNLKFVYDGPVGTYLGRQSNDHWVDAAIYVISPTLPSTDNVIVTGCTMTGFLHAVHNIESGVGWVVMDNHITGHWPAGGWISEETSSSNGYGFLCGSEGKEGGPNHICAYNTITQQSKAVSIGGDKPGQLGTNCDAYGNKCFDTLGTPISFDHSFENNRLWGNILAQCGAFSLTLQPQKSGPWYFMYNQITLSDNQNIKWRVQDRAVIINNTFYPGNDAEANNWTRCFSRNNLFLPEAQFIWTTKDSFATTPDVSRESQWFTSEALNPKVADAGFAWMGDVDYDGFDWGGGTNIAFRWNYDAGTLRTDFRGPDPFTDFYDEVGMEQNGIEVDADLIFVSKVYDPDTNLTLKSNEAYGGQNPAANSGGKVDNLADFGYLGAAPDRGCHHQGVTPPTYGQRTSELGTDLHLRTDDWTKH